MGLYDRDYTRENYQPSFSHARQMRMGMPRLTYAVKWLLIANVVVFFAQLTGANRFLTTWFSVYPESVARSIQVWRLISYQFLHGGITHILFNMIGLYFLGPVLERHWGTKRFVKFYLSCGAVGGLFYIVLARIGFLDIGPMIGASGAILGMLAACAILFPQIVVFFLFFPVPIRVAAVILIFIASAVLISRGFNAGGEAAHLAGMVAGGLYVFWPTIRTKLRTKPKAHPRQKRFDEQQRLHREVDEILEKVHRGGIHNLSHREKQILKRATKLEQNHNRL